jgi:hypothetical protein
MGGADSENHPDRRNRAKLGSRQAFPVPQSPFQLRGGSWVVFFHHAHILHIEAT